MISTLSYWHSAPHNSQQVTYADEIDIPATSFEPCISPRDEEQVYMQPKRLDSDLFTRPLQTQGLVTSALQNVSTTLCFCRVKLIIFWYILSSLHWKPQNKNIYIWYLFPVSDWKLETDKTSRIDNIKLS